MVVGTSMPTESPTLDPASAMSPFYLGRRLILFAGHKKYPTDEADRGRHTGFARNDGFAGGPGSLSLSFGRHGCQNAIAIGALWAVMRPVLVRFDRASPPIVRHAPLKQRRVTILRLGVVHFP